ncbi:Transposon Ty3-I Gag-Pol polyprotein [Vitis vinifera]|uniref:Transposon Ty3-I Gag-Pol polyprotein n=1 Tax=Vitis vinifera TaxID=29760 RepID=A0A438HVH8_VITVI|nr:Transposon Ty3-I Gag-Pol polyprotein [Vitis vinifera]
MMDDSKVKAIQEWDPPTKVPQLRSFLGLVNYYRRFIKGYSARVAPLIDLLKKNKAWEWDERGVLMQERHPIAFESRKLNDTERRYSARKGDDYHRPLLCAPGGIIFWSQSGASVHDESAPRNIMDLLREGLQHDPVAKSLIALAHEGKTKRSGAHGIASPWTSSWATQVEDIGSIIVVVDRFSKYATFIAAPTDCTAEETTRLFLKHVVKYWGLPKFIISDRNPRFTGKFWTELFKLMSSELHFSISFHPQTDGQTERVNALLELYLRYFMSANQNDWAKLLDIAQFLYNLQKSETTNKSPFELATWQQPLTPHL